MGLSRCFSNPRKVVRLLISRVHKGSRARGARQQRVARVDVRGPVVENSRQPQTRLNASNQAALLAAYAEGMPVRELSARFEVHRATINDMVSRAGAQVRKTGLPDPIREEAARLYAEGLTLPEVAAQLGIGYKSARTGIIASNVPIRPRGRQPL